MEFKYTRALLPGMFLDYDCVIIPELGGFVCNERTAWYDEDKEETEEDMDDDDDDDE